jgi:hypothetical protein
MFFQSNRTGGFGGNDLYVSRRRNKRNAFSWETPANLGSGVNTAANEAGAAHFKDHKSRTTTLYFQSSRLGGIGGNDIYASTLLPGETFGPARLVKELSSLFDDQRTAIRRDGLEIFLASNRTGTLGGMDPWFSTRPSTSWSWSTPVNLGPVVNSVNFDAGPALSFKGTELYSHSALRPGTVGVEGRFDLWVTTRAKAGGPENDSDDDSDEDDDDDDGRS